MSAVEKLDYRVVLKQFVYAQRALYGVRLGDRMRRALKAVQYVREGG